MHDDDVEHWHLDDTYEDVDGVERYCVTSVGVDIGSSTTHVMLSRLTVRRRGSDLSTQFEVSDREPLFVGAPMLTPYVDAGHIDVSAVEAFVAGCYLTASVTPDDVDTGAVVITGEALTKRNAGQIAEMLSRWCGDFVCISAGPNHEGILAAHGSGSVALSAEAGIRVLNIDMGGGTTKTTLVVNGVVEQVEAFSVGARLLAVDDAGVIVRLEEPALRYARVLGLDLAVGQPIEPADLDDLAALMADVLLDAVVPGPVGDLRRELAVTDPGLPPVGPVDRIVFSGGVSEYVDGRETGAFGDLGPRLGTQVRARIVTAGLADRVHPAEQGIRATVLGASQFTLQASGQTCFVPDESILPLRSVPVVRVDADDATGVEDALRRRLALRDGEAECAIALATSRSVDYPTLRGIAEALTRVAKGSALVVLMHNDLARALGRIIATECGHAGALTVIDGIDVGELDYLDIGRPLGATRSFPVTVKSLTLPAVEPVPLAMKVASR